MTKRIQTVKLMPVWIAISAVLIVAGIVLFALLGFNYSAEIPNAKSVEVSYDTVVTIGETTEADLQTLCENAFETNGLQVENKRIYEVTGGGIVEYFFSSTADGAKLDAAAAAIRTALTDADGAYADADTFVTVHSTENVAFTESIWRGAVAIASGCVVALVYLAIRFGVKSALTGLIGCVNNVLVTLAIFAICRIPVSTYAPLLFGAIAMAISLILWTVQCMKMRENFKDPAFRTMMSADAMEESSATAVKTIVAIVVAIAVAFAMLGGLAAPAVRLVFLCALIPVAVGAYSSLALLPSVHGHYKNILPKGKK